MGGVLVALPSELPVDLGKPGAVLGTPVDYELADNFDLTYVHTNRDRMVRPSQQRRYVGNLPDRTRRLRLDCGYSVSYARPLELARIVDRLLLNDHERLPRSVSCGSWHRRG